MNNEKMNEAILLIKNLIEWVVEKDRPECRCTLCADRRVVIDMVRSRLTTAVEMLDDISEAYSTHNRV